MSTPALNAIVTEARSVPTDPKAIAAELEIVNRSVTTADEHLASLFGIEARSKQKLETEIEKLSRRKAILESRARGGANYPPISLEALRKHRTKDGWPSVAIFSLDSAEFTISVRGRFQQDTWGSSSTYSTSAKITPELPAEIAACYDDVTKRLRDRSKREHSSFKLRAAFDGLIPLSVKKNIAAARPHFKQIFILAEPPGWSLTQEAVVQMKVDPLVVGWDGVGLFLIDEFDTSPVEEAIMLEGPANSGS